MTTTKTYRLDWVNILFLSLTPVVGITGTVWLLTHGGVPWPTWVLAFCLATASGLAITAGYHRLYSHKTFEASWPVRCIMLLFGAATFENSARKWCSDHRTHHQQVDREADPYNIQKGFWHAHIGWIFRKPVPAPLYDNVSDMMRDPLVRFQDRYYVWLAVAVGFALPMYLGSLWGDMWGGLLVAGVLRTVVNHHFTFSINSFCHMIGNQPYSNKNSARDSWILAIFTYGEGYHNFHHAFPGDYRNGIQPYHCDPAKWIIRVLATFGLVRNLRRIPDERILQARLRMDEERLLAALADLRAPATNGLSADMIAATRKRVEQAHAHFRNFQQEYRRMKSEKMARMQTQFVELKQNMIDARQQFHTAIHQWRHLYNMATRQALLVSR